ncbi:MAG: patatin-like phospholipase family protein [Mesorhizobium sp.]|nr:MAG: patatin-like phospholipase family protein [Mesorhizobium sp.]TIV31677.1 MAG: patatin-like phospholipase family protein [Mesorhizobium sp.]
MTNGSAARASAAQRLPMRRSHQRSARPSFGCIALLLQGGGALGSYQAGVYEALAEADLHCDWVAGISIGAINAAIIAGNAPDQRVTRLKAFWEAVSANPLLEWFVGCGAPLPTGDVARGLLSQIGSTSALLGGAAGFFSPRLLVPWLYPDGTIEATSYYETKQLKATLERLVDFERINSGEMRFSIGAVNVRTGNFVYFDNTTHVIRPEHVMASGALPPGFPPVEIDGEFYWDGGLISNTPLQWVAESTPRQDTLAFQVDLWSAQGEIPRNIAEVTTRQKEIQYSSRTRANTDQFKRVQRLRSALGSLLSKLPEELHDTAEARLLSAEADQKVYSLVHLIYRARAYEGHAKDYEFSRLAMTDHWRAGYHDAVKTLRHPEVLERPATIDGVSTFDLSQHGRE